MKKILIHGLLIGSAIGATAFTYVNGFKALEIAYVDTSVVPGNDFYTYVNGKWMEKAEIPSDRGRWGSFDELDKKADSMTLSMLDEAAQNWDKAPVPLQNISDAAKAIILYQTVLDLENRNAQGIEPIKPYLQEIQKIQKKSQIAKYMVDNAPLGESIFLGFYVSSDVKNSQENALYAYGPSLGLPDRDYYLKTDDKSVDIQNAYKDFMKKVFNAFPCQEDGDLVHLGW
jgi:putative endopeptidase